MADVAVPAWLSFGSLGSSTFMTITTNQNSRPVTVKIAVIFLLISIGIAIVQIAPRAHWSNPLAYVAFTLIIGLPLLFVWFIFQRKNWARWVFLIMFGLSTLLSFRSFHLLNGHPILTLLFFTHTTLQLVAAIALLLQPSNNWYRGNVHAA